VYCPGKTNKEKLKVSSFKKLRFLLKTAILSLFNTTSFGWICIFVLLFRLRTAASNRQKSGKQKKLLNRIIHFLAFL